MKLKLLASTLLLILIAASWAWGATTGSIQGEITDAETGEPLIGVTVVVLGTNLGAQTDQDGRYVILNVSVDTYTLRISSVGYATVEVSNVSVSADLATYQDQDMTSAATELADVIRVTAETPMVIPDKVASIQIIKAEEVQALPTRGFEEVVGIQTGVVAAIQSFRGGNRSNREAVNGAEMYIRGGRPSEVAYYVDGFSQQDPLTGTSTANIANGAIKEIAVVSGGFPVEYGHVTSGVVKVTTQSGTEDLKVRLETVTDQVYDQNWYAAQFGGPIPGIGGASFFGSMERRYHGDRQPSAVTSDVLPGSPDRLPNNSLAGWSFQGKIDYKLNQNIKLAFSGTGSRDKWQQYAHSRLFQPEHNAYYDDKNLGLNAKWTHTLNAKSFYNLSGSYFVTERFRGDGVHREDLFAYGRPNGNPTNDVEGLFRQWDNIDSVTPTVYETRTVDGVERQFVSSGDEGQVFDDYLRRKSSYLAFNGDITSELSSEHTLKGGLQFSRHTLRFYNHLFPTNIYLPAEETGDGAGVQDANRYGYDAFGNETDDDGLDWRNKTKNPVDLALYLQDRIEYRGLIITAGLRFDYFDYKGYNLLNPDLPLDPDSLQFDDDLTNDGLVNSLELEDLEEADAFTRLSPRLGIAFPVSEKTQMRISYGKFFQRPNLQDLYVGFSFMEFQLLGSGYFTEWGNPNLEPPKTTAYEVGVTRQLGDNASIDINLFYRDVSDLIQEVNQPSQPNSFGTFRNQDYGTIKGLEFNLKMRRTRNVSLDVKYTLSYASGTGSFNTEGRNSAWVRSDPPKHTSRLEFDQRHKISTIIDTRFGENQGPRLGDVYPLENFGINFLVSAGSGLPYSPVQIYNEAGRGSQAPNLIDVRNSQDRPWTMSIDFKAEKTLRFGSYKVTPYLWVKNLTDRDNEINAWEGTGRANSTGWLTTANGQEFLAGFAVPSDVAGLTGAEKYDIAQQPPGFYSNPRQVLFGLRMSF